MGAKHVGRGLADGGGFDSLFEGREVRRRQKRNGDPFLKLQLGDVTGAIEAVARLHAAKLPLRLVTHTTPTTQTTLPARLSGLGLEITGEGLVTPGPAARSAPGGGWRTGPEGRWPGPGPRRSRS